METTLPRNYHPPWHNSTSKRMQYETKEQHGKQITQAAVIRILNTRLPGEMRLQIE